MCVCVCIWASKAPFYWVDQRCWHSCGVCWSVCHWLETFAGLYSGVDCSASSLQDRQYVSSWAFLSRRFSEPQNIGKTQWIATFLPFRAPASSFFWLFSSLIFFFLTFSSLTLPTSAFPSVHIVGSLTFKLPSMIIKCVCLYIYIYNIYSIIYSPSSGPY